MPISLSCKVNKNKKKPFNFVSGWRALCSTCYVQGERDMDTVTFSSCDKHMLQPSLHLWSENINTAFFLFYLWFSAILVVLPRDCVLESDFEGISLIYNVNKSMNIVDISKWQVLRFVIGWDYKGEFLLGKSCIQGLTRRHICTHALDNMFPI